MGAVTPWTRQNECGGGVCVMACIYLYVVKGGDKEVVRMMEKREKPPCALCKFYVVIRSMRFFIYPIEQFINRPGTIQSPGDSLKELNPAKRMPGK